MCAFFQYVWPLDDNQPLHEVVMSLLILNTKHFGIKISKFNAMNFLLTTNTIYWNYSYRYLQNNKTYFLHIGHRHLFHTWTTRTNTTRYLTRDRTPLASMAYISKILYLPLYSLSSWLNMILFSLKYILSSWHRV